jgi:hypothetical protein
MRDLDAIARADEKRRRNRKILDDAIIAGKTSQSYVDTMLEWYNNASRSKTVTHDVMDKGIGAVIPPRKYPKTPARLTYTNEAKQEGTTPNIAVWYPGADEPVIRPANTKKFHKRSSTKVVKIANTVETATIRHGHNFNS